MRLRRRDGQPTAAVWLTALASLLLPVVGVGAAIYGIFVGAAGDAVGWYWAGAGILIVLADMVIDQIWFRAGAALSDEPDLNRRGMELVGQLVVVEDAIATGGRGVVCAGDSVWVAEGCPAEVGDRVRVTGVKGTALTVEEI
jgi:inner membrane protein